MSANKLRVLRLATFIFFLLGELSTSSDLFVNDQRAGDFTAARRNANLQRDFEGQNCDDESPATGVGVNDHFFPDGAAYFGVRDVYHEIYW